MSEWISVEDRLPPPVEINKGGKLTNKVLAVRAKDGEVVCRYYRENDWYDEHGNSTMNMAGQPENITHWMPLPEPPE